MGFVTVLRSPKRSVGVSVNPGSPRSKDDDSVTRLKALMPYCEVVVFVLLSEGSRGGFMMWIISLETVTGRLSETKANHSAASAGSFAS